MPSFLREINDTTKALDEMRAARAMRPYIKPMTEQKYRQGLADLFMKESEVQYAPEYNKGRASKMTSEAGLAGLEFQNAPESFNMRRQDHALSSLLKNFQINAIKRKLSGSGQKEFSPDSPIGKLIADRQKIAQMYGEDHPYVNQLDQAIQSAGMRGNGMGGTRMATYVDPETGETIQIPQTSASASRDLRVIAGAENVAPYLTSIKENLAQFQNPGKRLKEMTQGITNRYIGTNYELPSRRAEGEASVTTAAEGFLNTFGLNPTSQNVKKAELIFAPRFGESEEFYVQRLDKQLKDFIDVEKRAQERLGISPVNKGKKESKKESKLFYNPSTPGFDL